MICNWYVYILSHKNNTKMKVLNINTFDHENVGNYQRIETLWFLKVIKFWWNILDTFKVQSVQDILY